MGSFEVIRKPENITEVLSASLYGKFQFIAGVYTEGANWNGHVYKHGLMIEGAKVMARATSDDEVIITLTNSDSKYQRCIGTVELKTIKYILMLPEHSEKVFSKKKTPTKNRQGIRN